MIIYNNLNSQNITLVGLKDDTGAPVNTATITGNITRCNIPLVGGALSFSPVANVAGSYSAILNGFNANIGKAWTEISINNAGITLNDKVFTDIQVRSL
jgi:hypothetical protein